MSNELNSSLIQAAPVEAANVSTTNANRWATPTQTSTAEVAEQSNPWGAATQNAEAVNDNAADWLSTPAEAAAPAQDFQWSQLWDGSLPVQDWINTGIDWFVQNFRPLFQTVRGPIDALLGNVQGGLLSIPTVGMIGLITLLAWQLTGRTIAVGTFVSLCIIALLGVWPEAMITLALVLTSLLFCLSLGLPLGVLLARSDRAQNLLRPILDAMQTTPAFVYLVPVAMLFGIGNVPGVIVTIIFALPPLVRLTSLGIRQVRGDLVEAAKAYGASPLQLLMKVQLPLALPSIMAGINQTLMLSLSMVVIASMIAVGGLGQMVLRGIGRLDMGLATVGGIGIVLLAVVLDRITQSMGSKSRTSQRWYDAGPIGLVRRLIPSKK